MPRNDDAARAGQFAGKVIEAKTWEQLLGLCRGVLFDGVLNDTEIVALDQWCQGHLHLLPEWPAHRLAERVRNVLSDGYVDDQERDDLKQYLERISGPSDAETFDESMRLPLDEPEPYIEYEGRHFVLTGTFLYGARRKVEAAIADMGGQAAPTVASADYLVIGSTLTPDWKFASHGRKIEEAVRRRDEGRMIKIVSEAHWHTTLC